jgi:hypothetical protein
MIAYILLCSFVAFIAGVGVGIRYMHNKYNQRMLDNMKTLEELKLQRAHIEGYLESIKVQLGMGGAA